MTKESYLYWTTSNKVHEFDADDLNHARVLWLSIPDADQTRPPWVNPHSIKEIRSVPLPHVAFLQSQIELCVKLIAQTGEKDIYVRGSLEGILKEFRGELAAMNTPTVTVER